MAHSSVTTGCQTLRACLVLGFSWNLSVTQLLSQAQALFFLRASSPPGGQDLGRFYVSHDVQEVVAHEHPSLQQEEGEADAVPDDACLPAGQSAVRVIGSCRQGGALK